MSRLDDRMKIKADAIERMRALSFGDPVTNVCAGEGNPTRLGYFVEYQRKNKQTAGGLPYAEHWAKCTDKKGRFWNVDIKVVFAGHLAMDECQKLFAPIWESEHGQDQSDKGPKS